MIKTKSIILPREFDYIYFVPIGDTHTGDPAGLGGTSPEGRYATKKFRNMVKWIRNTPQAYTFLMGDLFDSVTKTSLGNVYEQDYNLKTAKDFLYEELKPIKDKILGCIDGNHCARIEKAVGDSPVRDLAFRLEIEYFPNWCAYLFLSVGDNKDNKSDKYRPYIYTVYLHHMRGGGATPGGKLNRLKKLKAMVLADLYCVSGNTMVKCIEGIYPIKDIRVGDLVLTKEGDYRKVTKIYKRKANTIQLKTRGGFQDLILTPEHPLLVQTIQKKKTSRGIDWLPIGVPQWKNAGDIQLGDFVAIAQDKHIDNSVKKIFGQQIDEQIAYFIGLYLAEGNITKNGIAISLHNKEIRLKNIVKDICRRFGISYTENLHEGTFSYQIFLNSKRLMTYFLEFGKTAHSKRIPEQYYYLNDKLIMAMLKGLYDGDGHKKLDREILVLKTVSKELAYQSALLLNRIGYDANVCLEKHPNKDVYIVSYSLNKNLVKRYRDNNYSYVEVIGKQKYKENMDVYNLEVEGSNTYTANGLIVHNCGAHIHLKGAFKEKYVIPDIRAKKLIEEQQTYVATGSFMGYASYSIVGQYEKPATGAVRVRLNGEPTKGKDIHASI